MITIEQIESPLCIIDTTPTVKSVPTNSFSQPSQPIGSFSKPAAPAKPTCCQIGKTSNKSGNFSNCKKRLIECQECHLWFCKFHHNVNMSDAFFSFGGHVCPARR